MTQTTATRSRSKPLANGRPAPARGGLTIPQTMSRLGLSRRTVFRLIRRGDLVRLGKGDGHSPVLISAASVEKYIKAYGRKVWS